MTGHQGGFPAVRIRSDGDHMRTDRGERGGVAEWHVCDACKVRDHDHCRIPISFQEGLPMCCCDAG